MRSVAVNPYRAAWAVPRSRAITPKMPMVGCIPALSPRNCRRAPPPLPLTRLFPAAYTFQSDSQPGDAADVPRQGVCNGLGSRPSGETLTLWPRQPASLPSRPNKCSCSQGLHPIAKEAWDSIHTIYSHVFETPLMPAPWLAELAESSTVHLKCECRQATGSFKARGAAHKLFAMSAEELERGVVAASTGNHASAVVSAAKAAAAQHRAPVGIRIFLPSTASVAAADRLRSLGADVVLEGRDCVEAEQAARQHAQHTGATYVSPYNDVAVAGGQGSVAIELLMQLPRGRLDTGGHASRRAAHPGLSLRAVPARCQWSGCPTFCPICTALVQCLCQWAAAASLPASLLS